MGWIFLALGLVLIVEGLAYALAPSLVEQMLALLRDLPQAMRRQIGIIALLLGIALAWIGFTIGVQM